MYTVQVDSTDEYGLTPLHMAVKFGVLDTVRILLQQGGDKSKYVLFQTFTNSTFIKKMLKLKNNKPNFSTVVKNANNFTEKSLKIPNLYKSGIVHSKNSVFNDHWDLNKHNLSLTVVFLFYSFISLFVNEYFYIFLYV